MWRDDFTWYIHFLGEGITPEDLNDDQIGRTLDAVHKFGLTELFFHIMMEIGCEFELFNGLAHLDTTTISVHGKYDVNENEIEVTHGHSKDHRKDLKQLTMTLGVSGLGSIPFWFEPLSGDSSDQKSFHKTIEIFQKYREEIDKGPTPIWVADSALYTAKRLLKGAHKFFWLSRVPEKIKEAKKLVEENNNKIKWEKLDNGYSIFGIDSRYQDISQRWVLVHSEQAMKQELITLERNIEKEEDAVWKAVKKIKKKIFHCANEAEEDFKKLKKSFKYYKFDNKKITPIFEKKVIKGYQLSLIMLQDGAKIKKVKNSKGKFLLATNFINKQTMADKDILKIYKEQSKVERGFRFIKDSSFLVSDVYVKKVSRFQALLFIMALTLMIYNFGQYWIRKKLQENDERFPNQVGKEIANPTLKWIFQTMRGIISVQIKARKKSIESVVNVELFHEKILEYFGVNSTRIYGFT